MALCEAVAYYKTKGMSLWDKMTEMYERYGYWLDGVQAITLKGKEGIEKIQNTIEKLRQQVPTAVSYTHLDVYKRQADSTPVITIFLEPSLARLRSKSLIPVSYTHLCGVKSGKDEDKFKNASLTKEPAKYVKAPLIKESPVNIECKVTDVVPCGSHDMFVAKVLCVHADKKYMDENGTFSFEKAKPIVYSHGWYYGLGKKIGKFGYSVIKKKAAKKRYRKNK